jgi:hypothetical protein
MKIPKGFYESKRNQQFRNKHPMCCAYKLIDLESKQDIVDARVFWRNGSMTCRAVVWISSPKDNVYRWGVGITTGGGYHHESAAIYDALVDMRIELEKGEYFNGAGTGAQEKAIKTIGESLGYKNTLLVSFNP